MLVIEVRHVQQHRRFNCRSTFHDAMNVSEPLEVYVYALEAVIRIYAYTTMPQVVHRLLAPFLECFYLSRHCT